VAAEAAAREALDRLQRTSAVRHLQGAAQCLVGIALERSGRAVEGAALVGGSHALIGSASLPEPYPSLCRIAAAPAG
jgi:hypothetical protein